MSRLARPCARARRDISRRTERTPSLVRLAARFRGEDALGLDVLDEPLVRARLADDATTINECTSRTALRWKFFGEFVSCIGWTYEQKSLRWYVATFSIRFYCSSGIHLYNYCTGEFNTDMFTEGLRFIWCHGVNEIEFVRRIAVILEIWAMRSISYGIYLRFYRCIMPCTCTLRVEWSFTVA
jgi:hypothetical protein